MTNVPWHISTILVQKSHRPPSSALGEMRGVIVLGSLFLHQLVILLAMLPLIRIGQRA